MANYILVHGAWRGGWVWESVTKHLRKAGHSAYAPSLTGLAERRHLLTSGVTLDTRVQDIVSLMEFEDLRNVTLCEHSAGGLVITGVAERITEQRKLLCLGEVARQGFRIFYSNLHYDGIRSKETR